MEELFEGLETVQDVDTGVKDVVRGDNPSFLSPEWNDYVMSFFEKNEQFDGRPTVHGLRRVAEILIGQIVSSKPTQVFPPSNCGTELGRATVVWEITFSDGSVFSDVADCWEGNTDDTFIVFNTATAATRAEGRALRKALRLRTVAAEEMTSKDTGAVAKSITLSKQMEQPRQDEYVSTDLMTDPQLSFLDGKSKQLNIDVIIFMKEVFKVNVKRKVTKGEASLAIQKLNEYQQDPNSIPQNCIGYKSNWND